MAIPQRPRPDLEELRQFYVGKDVRTVPKPAVVLDSAKIRRHCQSMLDAVKALGVDFRAHVKTHKTEQIARLQVGDKTQDANFIVSTVSEIEHLLPTLKALQQDSRHTNVLYGVPLLSSQVSRLANLNRELGPGSISVMIDHPSHIESLMRLYQLSKLPVGVFLKIDTGYHRAGLPVSFLDKDGLLDKLNQLEDENKARLVGIYSHSSLSYRDSSADQAMNNLAAEIEGCIEAFNAHEKLHFSRREMVISVGASPQVTSVENLTTGFYSPSSNRLRAAIQKVREGLKSGFRTTLELHAGVYAVLDMQQMSTRSRQALGSFVDEVAISVVAEVCSVYNHGERQKSEALVAVGTLGLGRESCPSYSGWGITAPYPYAGLDRGRSLVVDRISQEHSVISWADGPRHERETAAIPLEVGQTVRIYPNHACVTGALYGWYLVVDSDRPDPNGIVDVWIRGSGW